MASIIVTPAQRQPSRGYEEDMNFPRMMRPISRAIASSSSAVRSATFSMPNESHTTFFGTSSAVPFTDVGVISKG